LCIIYIYIYIHIDMDIIAITVSVNYHDILQHIIHQNAKFLKLWYIITSPDDVNTIRVIKESNLPNIEILIYNDFFTPFLFENAHKMGVSSAKSNVAKVILNDRLCKNVTFDKGGAILYAQQHIDNYYTDANIVILDSDIYLPDNFMDNIPKDLDNNTLYGVSQRLDYWTLNDFKLNRNSHNYPAVKNIVGFFQLYKQCSYKYKKSNNCSQCDDDFKKLFKITKQLPLSVKHLGREKVNWNGRNFNYKF
jgi:hypothetical protein